MRYVFEYGRYPHVHKEVAKDFETMVEALAFAVNTKAYHAYADPKTGNPETVYNDKNGLFYLNVSWAMKLSRSKFYRLSQYLKAVFMPWRWYGRFKCHRSLMPCQFVDGPNDNNWSLSDA